MKASEHRSREIYDHHWRSAEGPLCERERRRADAVLSMIPRETESVLEVGCGDGLIINQVGGGINTMGIDISAEALERVSGPCMVGSAGSMPFADKSWDVVVASEVLEHVAADGYEASLSEIARVARKTIIVTVPNSENLTQLMTRCPECGHRFNSSYHLRTFEPRVLYGLFPGFSLARCEEFGHSYRVAGRLESFVRWRLLGMWLPFRGDFTCPSCGYRGADEQGGGRGVSTAIEKSGLKTVVSRLLGRKRPRWIAAVYVRDGG